ncbi:hypothetical protein [Rhizobium sp. CECT 9324]|uniref:hypothetical protein n=1 Tax=Rhizobium sp. CECT 9324 TaxID=2845820 RepID=UPI001E583EF0|nr:hypothetical protein [Rhizobium sp. CECT 9324]CAH0343774.1 hypothetical protein RHI9324_05512 [Rhizobium sp. CECT 9324]
MKVYNYDPDTREYVGWSEADESPRQPGVWLIPAFSTDTPPPDQKSGFVRKFVNGAWIYSLIEPEETDPETPPDPEPIDPLTLPMDRLTFWLVAASAGVSKWSVRDRVAGLPEETVVQRRDKYEAIAWLEEAKQYRRYDLLLMTFAEAEGITSDMLDTLWKWGIHQQET